MPSNWSSDYDDPRWKEKREKILERDNHQCVICGGNETLQVHHGFYETDRRAWTYPDHSLWTLCKSCHDTATFQNRDLKRIIGEMHPSRLDEILSTIQAISSNGETDGAASPMDEGAAEQSDEVGEDQFDQNEEKNISCPVANYDSTTGAGEINFSSPLANINWTKRYENSKLSSIRLFYANKKTAINLHVCQGSSASILKYDETDTHDSIQLNIPVDSVEAFLPDGTECPHSHITDGKGVVALLHQNGCLRLKGHYDRHLPNGRWEQFDNHGRVTRKGTYEEGQKVGWHTNLIGGHPVTERYYQANVFDGKTNLIEDLKPFEWDSYHYNGVIAVKRRWDEYDYEMKSFCRFDENGRKHGCEVLPYDPADADDYDPAEGGYAISNVYHKNGVRHGPCIIWGRDKSLEACYFYEEGRLVAEGNLKTLERCRKSAFLEELSLDSRCLTEWLPRSAESVAHDEMWVGKTTKYLRVLDSAVFFCHDHAHKIDDGMEPENYEHFIRQDVTDIDFVANT